MSDVSAFYMFWDYSDEYEELQGNKFYLDNIEFTADYKVFDGEPYNMKNNDHLRLLTKISW